jgi:hypothetical protein
VDYWGYWRGVRTALHRAIWTAAHGPIPDGNEIHHRDQNPLNNALDNLECMTPGEHRRREAELGTFSSDKQKAHLGRIRHKASAWHRSDEGRAWHAAMSAAAWKNVKPHTVACRQCGSEFQTRSKVVLYCGAKCQRAAKPQVKRHLLTCELCRSEFRAFKKQQRWCSYSCSAKARWKAGVFARS